MDKHVSFSSLPQPASPQPYSIPGQLNHHLGITSQPLSRSAHLEPFGNGPWINHLLNQIIQHPQFGSLFPFIKSCLHLNEQTWTAYVNLREDREAKSKLHILHPSLFNVPPDDVWSLIVRLRQRPTFSNFQPNVVARVEQAYCHTLPSFSVPQFDSKNKDGGFWHAAQAGQDSSPGSVQTPSASTSFPTEQTHHGIQKPDPGIPIRTPCSPPQSTMPIVGSGNLRHRQRQAPDGMLYQCPSQGCSRMFKRVAHYTNHIARNHPDFGPRHPNHSAEMALREKPSPSPSHNRSTNSVRFEDQPSTSAEHEIFRLRPSARSRRGSHLSLSSLNSIGVSSSAMDDLMDESLDVPPEIPEFDLQMLHDSSLWHTGGGPLLDGTGLDPRNYHFMGSGNV